MGSGLLQRQAAARGRQLADGQHARPARGITTALAALQDETGLASETRQIKSLNHRVKQDHRLIQRILQSLLGFSALASARCTVRV
jgi:transposase-like protein